MYFSSPYKKNSNVTPIVIAKTHFQTKASWFVMALLTLVLCCSFSVYAIANVTRLSPDNGLSQGVVYAMKLDSTGQLWLATESDLDRFDGTSVRAIRPMLNLSSDIIWDFEFVSATKLQIASADAGLIELDLTSGMPTFLQPINSQSLSRNEAIHLIRQDQHKKRWYANSLAVYQTDEKGQLQQVVRFNGRDPDIHHIRDLLIFEDILVIATSTGLYRFDLEKGTLQQIHYLPDGATEDQLNSKSLVLLNDYLYIGTVQGLYRVPARSLKNLSDRLNAEVFLQDLNIWKIKPSEHHGLLLGTSSGLVALELDTLKDKILFQPGATTFEYSDDTVLDFIEMPNGTFWLGSRGDGAYFWNNKENGFLNVYNNAEHKKLSHNFVFGLYGTADDLWIGTQNGLNRYHWEDGKMEQFLVKQDKSIVDSDSTIYGIYPQGSGQFLWLLSATSLSKFDTHTQQVIAQDSTRYPGFFEQYFHSIAQTPQNDLLVLNRQGPFLIANNGSISPLVNLAKLIEEPTQAYWFGMNPASENEFFYFYQGAIWRYQLEQDLANPVYKVPDHLNNQGLYAEGIQQVGQSLWFLISGLGLVELDSHNLQVKSSFFDSNESTLSTSTLYALQKDQFGYLWMSSHSGLWRFNPQTHFLRQFSNRSGLAYNEFNSSSAYFSIQRNKMVFGSLRGVTIFDPSTFVAKQKTTPTLYISDILLESRALKTELIPKPQQEIELRHDDYGFKVQVSTFNYLPQDDISYRFELTGAKDLPIYTKSTPNLSLPNLLPGAYSLKVTAFDPASEQQSAPALLQLRVAYPPWASPFAYFAYFTVSLSILLFWLRTKMKQRTMLLQQHIVLMNIKNKLELALKVAASDVWEVDLLNDSMAFSHRMPLIFGAHHTQYPMAEYLAKLHPDDSAGYFESWQALKDGESEEFACVYRVQTLTGEWRWYKDVGKLAANQPDKSLKVYGMYTDITTQKLTELELEQLSNFDQITGLPNRNLLQQYLADTDSANQFTGFIVLKLLQFTEIKNAFGELTANSLLLQVSSRLRSKISTPDLLTHVSESLFIVALQHNSSTELAEISELLLAEFAAPMTVFEHQITISCIAGTACQTGQCESAQELLKQAEIALRVARESGGYQHYSYKKGLLEQTKQKFILQQQLRDAISQNTLINYYQPIVNASTGMTVGVELLLRWNNEGDFVSPDIFIPIAEQTGLIDELTCNSVESACVDLKYLQQQGVHLYLSVNFSATQLCSRSVMIRLQQILQAHQISPVDIRIEITESTLIQNKELAIQNMTELRKAGYKIFLDDFGTGYSSLKYIQDFPLDAIKIDRSFVSNIDKNKNAAIIDTIITLADSLNVVCIAEGVETELQRDYLLSKNCRYMQGYLYSKPQPISRLLVHLGSPQD